MWYQYQKYNFRIYATDYVYEPFLWNVSFMIVIEHHIYLVSIGSGNGLVSPGNKPLPDPMLTQICVRYGVSRPYSIPSYAGGTSHLIAIHNIYAIIYKSLDCVSLVLLFLSDRYINGVIMFLFAQYTISHKPWLQQK